MKKTLLALFVVITSVQYSKAQYSPSWSSGDTSVYAFNKDWDVIDNLKAATYFRKAYPLNKSTYKVMDYYTNGQVQMVATQSEADPAFSKVNYYGEKVYFTENGDTSAYYKYDKEGNSVGTHFSKHENGQLEYKGVYTPSKKKVVETRYFENGQLDNSITKIDNKKVGDYSEYYKNGQLYCSGKYDAGDRIGTWKYFHDNGVKKTTYTYLNGKANGDFKEYSKGDTLIIEGEYSEGKKVGEWIYYHDNGQLESKVTYDDGKRNGKIVEYSNDGKVVFEGKYSKGDPVGVHKTYNHDGVLIKEVVFGSGYPALKTTEYYTNGNVKYFEKGDKKTYYSLEGKKLKEDQIQSDPIMKTDITGELSKSFIEFPDDLKLKNGRAVFVFNISKEGVVNDVDITESMSDSLDHMILNLVKSLEYISGSYYQAQYGFKNSIAVILKDGKWQVVTGKYMPEKSLTPISKDEKAEFTIVEEMPSFPNGEPELFKYLGQTVKYPSVAKDNGIQGVVYVNFTVNECGIIQKVNVIRGVHPSLDLESIRVIENMPVWEPGKQKGVPVRVSYNLPIRFVLR